MASYRRGEKRKSRDCKIESGKDVRRRSPKLTSSSDELEPVSRYEHGNGVSYDHTDTTKADASWLPEKHILELVLDTLQRRDTHDIFSEPVDPIEVEEYYEIITEPMDFGTMRAKLHEGLYQNLQQFEHDMYLIFENAMYFNSSGTVYFRQARALEDLAKKVFHALKTNPDNFEAEFIETRRRSSRKVDGEPRGSIFCSGQMVTRELGSNSISTDMEQKGSRRSRRPHISGIDRRSTYYPWKSAFDGSDSTISPFNLDTKPLMQVDQGNVGYARSLLTFVHDLGPTAQRVAQHKLQGLRLQTTTYQNSNNSCSSTNAQISSATPLFQTNTPNKQEKTGLSMIRVPNVEDKTSLSTVRASNIQEKTGLSTMRASDIQDKMNISTMRAPNIQEKTSLSTIRASNIQENAGLSTIREAPEGKIVKTLDSSKTDAKTSAGNIHNKSGIIVMGLVARAKGSKINNQVRKFDLNQAQPNPTSTRVSSDSKDGGLMARATSFEPLPTSKLNRFSNPDEPKEAFYKQHVHNMLPPFYPRQFLFNVPYLESRLNVGNTQLPIAMQLGPSRMSFGQGSSSQGYIGRSEYLDINQSPFAHQKNCLPWYYHG